MATDKRTTELTAATSIADTDLVPVVQDVATVPATKKAAWSLMKSTLKTYFDTYYAQSVLKTYFDTVYAALAHASRHKTGGADAIKLDELAAPTDVTTLNASTTAHGLMPKLSGVSTEFLNGLGAWATPAGGGGAGGAGGGASGWMANGKIVTSVASNNLTVAIKTLAGADPSANDPVTVRIGDVMHTLSAALSITRNAGTNWLNLGASETATKEVDLFVYLGYNATDGVTIGFSRMPYFRVYGDASTTTNNDRHLAVSTITNAAAADRYDVVGRFNAILSAGAGYTWSIPATSIVINRPIFESRLLDYVPTRTPAAGTLSGITAVCEKYKITGDRFFFEIYTQFTTNGSAPGYISFTVPLTLGQMVNFSAIMTDTAVVSSNVTSSGNLLYVRKYDGSGFAIGGSKDVRMTFSASLV